MFQLNLSSEAVINFDSASDPVPFDTGPKTLPKRMIVQTLTPFFSPCRFTVSFLILR